jgi:hypothetical protein
MRCPSIAGQAAAHGFDFGQFGHGFGPPCHGVALYQPRYNLIRGKQRSAKGKRGTAGMSENDKTTHFGFQTVGEDQKAGLVHGVFTRVASKYDVMNDLMSMGVHRVWKDAMMDWLAPRPGQRLLDVAGGTGMSPFRFLKRAGAGRMPRCWT